MKSIIEKIYYGDLHPCEESAPPTDEYIKNRKAICAIEDEILQKFPDCRAYLDRYQDTLGAESQYESEADFARGFRLGVLLMFDVLTFKKDDI